MKNLGDIDRSTNNNNNNKGQKEKNSVKQLKKLKNKLLKPIVKDNHNDEVIEIENF